MNVQLKHTYIAPKKRDNAYWRQKRRERLANLDAVIPSEREKKFFDFYMKNGRHVKPAFYSMRESEGTLTDTIRNDTTRALHGFARRFLARPGVQKLLRDYDRQVAKLTEKKLAKYSLSEERVLEELIKIAFTNPTDLMSWDASGVRVKPSAELTEDEKSAIGEVDEVRTKEGVKIKIKNIDKTKALELLAKKLGMFTERHEHKHLAVNFIIEDK